MNVIGLDLSLNGTGICISDHQAFTVKGNPKNGDLRLVGIHQAVDYYVRESRPAFAVVEGLPFGSNDRMVALVHGVVRMLLAGRGVPFAYIYPTALKVFATGAGTADKAAMRAAAVRLGAAEDFDHDQIDAWWLRRAGLAAIGDTTDRAERVAALGGVDWPPIVGAHGKTNGKAVIKKCRHGTYSLKNGDHWLHPFLLDRCDKPPK